jgi:putative membrane protein
MAGHILVMNALAPLLALNLAGRSSGQLRLLERGRALASASILQIVVLWSVHAPPVIGHLSGAAHLPLQAILFGIALFFWSAVFSQRGPHRWRALLVLLITGKLFCLLGVLLVFAPRLLYPALPHGHDALVASPMLADQQFAGLIMIVACPLSYVLAAILIAARWLNDISRNEVGPYLVRNGDR